MVTPSGAIKYDETTMGAPDEMYPLLVNGANVSTVPMFNTSQNRVRFRLLNASIGDILTLSFTRDARSQKWRWTAAIFPAR